MRNTLDKQESREKKKLLGFGRAEKGAAGPSQAEKESAARRIENRRRFSHERLFSLLVCPIFGSLTFALKIAMAGLPNIEPVTLMLMLTALVFGWKAFLTAGIYVLLEGLVYGFSSWWLVYLYAWPLLVLITLPLRRFRSPVLFALVAGGYGFLFGFLFLPVNIIVYPLDTMEKITFYILQDIPFNLIHGVSNLIIGFVLLSPLRKALEIALAKVRGKTA